MAIHMRECGKMGLNTARGNINGPVETFMKEDFGWTNEKAKPKFTIAMEKSMQDIGRTIKGKGRELFFDFQLL